MVRAGTRYGDGRADVIGHRQQRRGDRAASREEKRSHRALVGNPQRVNYGMQLDASRKALFLRELSAHGVIARAARCASPGSDTGAMQTFRDARAADAEFAAAWDAALEVARSNVEYELHRRSVEGWDEPVYGGRYREEVVGTVRRYSDRLLELRVKGLLPQYREGASVQLNNYLQDTAVSETRAKFTAALAQMSIADLDEFEGLMVRAIQLLGGKVSMGLESDDDCPQSALIEFGLGTALQHQGQPT